MGRSGGIGRRAGFKIPSWQQGVGSSPTSGSFLSSAYADQSSPEPVGSEAAVPVLLANAMYLGGNEWAEVAEFFYNFGEFVCDEIDFVLSVVSREAESY